MTTLSNTPPEPLCKTLSRLQCPIERVSFVFQTGPAEHFRRFAHQPSFDFGSAIMGNEHELANVHMNAVAGAEVIRVALEKQASLGEGLDPRSHVAAAHIHLARESLQNGLVLHLVNDWSGPIGAISHARSALECAAAANWYLLETLQVANEYWTNDDRPRAGKTLSVLNAFLAQARWRIPDANKAYGWMCGFSHLDRRTVLLRDKLTVEAIHKLSFVALAYAAVATALVAERLLGHDAFACAPPEWPSELDWT
jgi:hypothetical protein